MRFGILGSGAVGGYYGAKLARAGHDVTFIARGAHLAAIRERGLAVRSPMLGDFTVRARAEEDTAKVGPVDVVIVAVKAYDNASALPLLAPMLGSVSSVLTLQNGVDSVQEVAALVGEEPVIGGTTYVATALSSPGVIEQTGTHRRIVFGEVFGSLPRAIGARPRDSRRVCGRGHPVGARGRWPGTDLGEVHLPRRARRIHGRVEAADRAALGRPGRARAVSRRVPRSRAVWPVRKASMSRPMSSNG